MVCASFHRRLRWLAILVLAFASPMAFGDEVVLRDGRRLEGKVLRRDKKELVLRTDFGELTFDVTEIVRVVYGKTRTEIFDERWKAAKTASHFFDLGTWAAEVKLRSASKRAMRRAIELDAGHEAAHRFLGHVLYRGEWMSEKDRDRRAAADADAERRAKGLVPFGDRWVTPEDKTKLEAGLVQVDGVWMEYAEAQRLRGLEEFLGEWLPWPEALARRDILAWGDAVQIEPMVVLTDQAAIAGPFPDAFLTGVGAGIARGRIWFEERFASNAAGSAEGNSEEKGRPDPLGGRLSRVILLARDSDAFSRTVDHFAQRGRYLPEDWATSARRTHGFYWWDPMPLSVARQGERGEADLAGHTYHQWGHLLANLEGYDGRLLPPWYDEGLAGLMEFHCHDQNRVFCRGTAVARPGSGTTAARASVGYDRADLRGGRWRKSLADLLKQRRVQRFDKLAGLQFGELTEPDTAAAMGILSWLETRGEGALAAFHAVLRRGSPKAPARVDPDGHARGILYNEAFTAAAGMVRQEADQAWRAWILNQ
jgi:hypothetical protein